MRSRILSFDFRRTGSLLRKTSLASLSAEQSDKLEKEDIELSRTNAQTALAQMGQFASLREGQWIRLVELVEKEIPLTRAHEINGSMLVLYRVIGLPEDKLKTVLDGEQYAAWSRKAAQDQPALRRWLEQRDMLNEDRLAEATAQ